LFKTRSLSTADGVHGEHKLRTRISRYTSLYSTDYSTVQCSTVQDITIYFLILNCLGKSRNLILLRPDQGLAEPHQRSRENPLYTPAIPPIQLENAESLHRKILILSRILVFAWNDKYLERCSCLIFVNSIFFLINENINLVKNDSLSRQERQRQNSYCSISSVIIDISLVVIQTKLCLQ